MICFFKTELVAQKVLIDIATDIVATRMFQVKRFPSTLLGASPDAQYGFTTGVRGTLVNSVNCDVGEQRYLRRDPTCG